MSTSYWQWIAYLNSGSGDGNGPGFVCIPLGSMGAGTFSSKLAFSSLEGIRELSIIDLEGSL